MLARNNVQTEFALAPAAPAPVKYATVPVVTYVVVAPLTVYIVVDGGGWKPGDITDTDVILLGAGDTEDAEAAGERVDAPGNTAVPVSDENGVVTSEVEGTDVLEVTRIVTVSYMVL
jgi:hypothetical protein